MVFQFFFFEITEKEGNNKITKFILKIASNMEELLSKCILYNLNILKHAVACTEQMQETLVEVIFEEFSKTTKFNFLYISGNIY